MVVISATASNATIWVAIKIALPSWLAPNLPRSLTCDAVGAQLSCLGDNVVVKDCESNVELPYYTACTCDDRSLYYDSHSYSYGDRGDEPTLAPYLVLPTVAITSSFQVMNLTYDEAVAEMAQFVDAIEALAGVDSGVQVAIQGSPPSRRLDGRHGALQRDGHR